MKYCLVRQHRWLYGRVGNVSSSSQPLILIPSLPQPHVECAPPSAISSIFPFTNRFSVCRVHSLDSSSHPHYLSTSHSTFPSGSSHTLACTWNSTGCSGMTISICPSERAEFVSSFDAEIGNIEITTFESLPDFSVLYSRRFFSLSIISSRNAQFSSFSPFNYVKIIHLHPF